MELRKVATKDLLVELYDRVDDNLYAPERRYDLQLDEIERMEKVNLCQLLRLIKEDYLDE